MIPSVKVGRVQNFRSWSPEMVPDGGSTCLGLEYFCFEGDGLWTRAGRGARSRSPRREIGKIGLIAPDDVVDACVVRQPKAYPVYDDDYRDNVATVRRRARARLSRRCISSAATACTSTTTRTTP